ncbi:LysR family transcriptional regulator [Roseibium sp. HPY-6]|uniref:LysR family transcriptional regulator n=1 Tax=Roseibium sp. HPY-6 TaxID=3229852 RepID=UPI00338D4981
MISMKKIERLTLNSDLLRAFVVIAEQGHLTFAAERLNRTQSALSVQLRKLETGLDTKLFYRHAKGMKLTPDGEKLLPVAQGILSDMLHAQKLFDKPLRGKVHVGIPDHYDDTVFETVLTDFGKTYPLLDIYVKSGCSAGFATAIREGRLDVAVVSGQLAEHGEVLETEPNYWVESEEFEADADEPVPLGILDRGCWWSNLPLNLLTKHQRAFNIKFRSESFSNLRCAIRSGLAIGVLPERAIQKGMRIAGPRRRLPDLPAMVQSLLVSETAAPDITGAIAGALKEGLASE